jgi:hypothetical protein
MERAEQKKRMQRGRDRGREREVKRERREMGRDREWKELKLVRQ